MLVLFIDFSSALRKNRMLYFGGVPEWLKGPDCKSGGSAFVGSNPTPSTKTADLGWCVKKDFSVFVELCVRTAGVVQW